MFILEIIAIGSSVVTVGTGVFNFVIAVRKNRYAADFARINQLNQHQRGKFTEIIIPQKSLVIGHTHPHSAASRSAGSTACAAYALASNKIPFYVSMSASDQRAGREGERIMHWAKDFNAEQRKSEPTKDNILVMVDVDEHIQDLGGLLHKHQLPVIMYTFQPSVAAGVFKDYRFTFNKDNEVIYEVAGGGKYVHQVYDYSPDTVVIKKKILGFTYAKSFFTVEKRYVDENHQLVLLTPLARFGLLGSIMSSNISGSDLARFTPVQGEFIRMRTARSMIGQSKEYEHKTSTCRVGEYNAATVDIEKDDAIAATARSSKEVLNTFQIKSMIPDIEHSAALSLLEYHRQKIKTDPAKAIIPTDAVNNYTYNPVYSSIDKPSVTAFMSPIIPECYAPTECIENEEAMIKGRITGLSKPADYLDEKFLKYAFEFTQQLQQELGVLHPVDFEQVNSRLSRPTQRRITESAGWTDKVKNIFKSFMKKESYQKVTEPRPIATLDGKLKVGYSGYMYALSEVLKETSWYAFGRKPKQIAERVAAICQLANHITNTDLSRFDGRVNRSSRQFEEMLMMALFPSEYHKEMLELMRKQYGAPGVGKLGTKYKNGFNRQSGSPETAALNTVLNAFMAYCCYREQDKDMLAAYASLGIYGGDDGLSADVAPETYVRVCAMFGHVLEVELIKRGEMGVSFLARMYSPAVWSGSPHSCADIARAGAKFHVSTAPDVPAVDKLFEKAYSLSLTDSNTPILGPLVTKAVELSGKSASDYKNILRIWNSDVTIEDHYPNENHDQWMHLVIERQKLTGFNHELFETALNECKELSDMLSLPQCIERGDLKIPEGTFRINGELYVHSNGKEDAPVINPSVTFWKDPIDEPSPQPTNTNNKPSMGPSRYRGPTFHGEQQSAGHNSVDGDGPTNLPAATTRAGRVRPSGGGAGPISNSGNRPPKTGRRGTGENQILGEQLARVNMGSKGKWVNTGRKNQPPPICPTVSTTPPSPRLVGIETNPGPQHFTFLPEHIQTHPDEDALLSMGADLVEAGYAFVPDSVVHNIEHLARTDPFTDVNEGYIKPFTKRVVSALEPVIDYFAGHSQINGNNGSATNTDDHPKGPTKGPLKNIVKEINQITQHQQNQQKMNRAVKPKQQSPQMRQEQKQSTNGGVPANMSHTMSNGSPKITRGKDWCRIDHTELVIPVQGTVGWATQGINFQPGLISNFRWLATQVNGWEKYKVNRLRVHYVTRCSTATGGTVVLAPDLDAADSAPSDEITAMSFFGSKGGPPWRDFSIEFDVKRSGELYIRTGPLAPSLDIKSYDFGTLFLGTTDGAVVNWGKLFFQYDITLLVPQALGTLNQGGYATSLTGVSLTNPLGTAQTVYKGSMLDTIVRNTAQTGNTVTFTNLMPGKDYQVITTVIGTGLTVLNTAISGSAFAAAIVNDLVNATGTTILDQSRFTAGYIPVTMDIVVTGTTVTTCQVTVALVQQV